MPARSNDILCDFLGRRQTSATTAAPGQRSAATVTKATATLLATARAVIASCPASVAKAATTPPPRTGPRYIERAPATPRAATATAEAVFQAAVRAVPEPDGASSAAAAFDEARARRDDGRYGTSITGGNRS